MNIRTLLTQSVVLVLPWLLASHAVGQETEGKKLELAFQWSRQQFENENSRIERVYQEEIRAAQLKRAEAIQGARVRFQQGLEFLNTNPELPQSMREQINDLMRQIAALPEPVAPEITEMPEAKKTDSDQPNGANRKEVTVQIDAPDSGWSIRILQAKRVNDEIWVLSALEHAGGISTMVVTPVSDSAFVDAPPELVVRHFVLNKTWKSNDEIEGIQFIDGVPALGRDWVFGKILKPSREPAEK